MGGGRTVKGGRDEEGRGGMRAAVEKKSCVFFSFLARPRTPSLVRFHPPSCLLQLPQNREEKNLTSKQRPGQRSKPVHKK